MFTNDLLDLIDHTMTVPGSASFASMWGAGPHLAPHPAALFPLGSAASAGSQDPLPAISGDKPHPAGPALAPHPASAPSPLLVAYAAAHAAPTAPMGQAIGQDIEGAPNGLCTHI
jgi:hypothetical protein